MTITTTLTQLQAEFNQACHGVDNEQTLLQIKKKYLKDALNAEYQKLKTIADPEQKRDFGKALNELRSHMEARLNEITPKTKKTQNSIIHADASAVKHNIQLGRLHPLTSFLREIEDVFSALGFEIAEGPEIETELNNFTKLNIPDHHPARDMQDTFFVSNSESVLRSHTSSVQIRTMEARKPPLKIISPGTVYRVDDIDPQHTPMFTQLEGLVVGENIRFSDLKGTLIAFIQAVFGVDTEVTFRPSYYPYTEPSAAVDMSCMVCHGKGCRTCKNSGKITILGAGMIHPNVFKAVGYNPKEVSGFAFGLGINRLAMIYYRLPEMRAFYENNTYLWAQL